MKVARMMLTMLKLMPSRDMMPRIQIQLTAIGTKEITASSMRRNDSQRKRKTMEEQTQPM